jgi:hypothetical protein
MLTHAENTAISAALPGLQLAWDSTSMGELKLCPRKYYYRILYGYTPRELSVHLKFGLGFHSATEHYDHARARGENHDAGVRAAIRRALEFTWDFKMGRPWLSSDPNKNRQTLVRTIAWYYEQFAHDPLETVILATGKPAVELSFMVELPFKAQETGESFFYGGHLDRVALMGGSAYIVDKKTTKHTLNKQYFDGYSPDNQFSGYMFGGAVGFGLKLQGIICDAAQVAVGFTRFQREVIHRTKEQLEEWVRDLGMWLRVAEFYAKTNYWPQNDKNCSMYGGCPFRSVCGKTPGARPEWLRAGFERQVWNPLIARGDI